MGTQARGGAGAASANSSGGGLAPARENCAQALWRKPGMSAASALYRAPYGGGRRCPAKSWEARARVRWR